MELEIISLNYFNCGTIVANKNVYNDTKYHYNGKYRTQYHYTKNVLEKILLVVEVSALLISLVDSSLKC